MTTDDAPRDLLLGDERLPLVVRVNARARKLSLRLDPARRQVVLTLPREHDLRQGLDFLHRQDDWLIRQARSLPPLRRFADRQPLPVLGETLTIDHRADSRRGTWRDGDLLCVSGDGAHLPRRVRDWLKQTARQELQQNAHRLAARIARPVRAVSVRDTTSRWGSCTADGRLSFCWRLVLAPRPVLDYVVAHEVAHLRRRAHDRPFWHLVEQLMPDYRTHQDWLRRNGASLHAWH